MFLNPRLLCLFLFATHYAKLFAPSVFFLLAVRHSQ